MIKQGANVPINRVGKKQSDHRSAVGSIPAGFKMRRGPNGVHIFDRRSGLNVLLDEVKVDRADWSAAPRDISDGCDKCL